MKHTKKLFIFIFLGLFMMSLVSSEYKVFINADNVTESNFNIYGVTADNVGNNLWAIISNETTDELRRAKIMKALFYGNDGQSNLKINEVTNISIISSTDVLDVGRRVHTYRVRIINGDGTSALAFQKTGTFESNAGNTSFWSYISSQVNTGGCSSNTVRSEFESGNTILSLSSAPNNVFNILDEVGTNTLIDNIINPLNFQLEFSETCSNGLYQVDSRALILTKGNITDSDSISPVGVDTFSHIDYFYDYNIPLFSEAPNINILSENSAITGNPFLFDINITTINNNVTNATLYINGTVNETKNITGTYNNTIFNKTFNTIGNKVWSIIVCNNESICSSTGNQTLSVQNYIEDSITFNNQTIEGTTENFILNLSLATGVSVTSSNFYYNGQQYTPTISTPSETIITNQINIPDFPSDINVTFYWNYTLSTGETITSSLNNQSVLTIQTDDCSTYANQLFNLSLFDERTLAEINGTIEFSLDLLNLDGSLVTETSTNLTNAQNSLVCSNVNITKSIYLYDVEMRYFSPAQNGTVFAYAPEFYHIQKGLGTSFPQIINLYDLNGNESTEFTIFYRDNNYVLRGDVLLQIQRKYISEGIYRTIEIPITSSQGSTTAHFDLNNYKYKIIAIKDGVVLNTFDNPTIKCESVLSGICELFLNGQPTPINVQQLYQEVNFRYTLNTSNNSVTIDYIIPSGESKTINITMIQNSPFTEDTVICSQELLTSSGSLECFINSTIGDSNVRITIYSDGVIKGDFIVTFQEDLSVGFLLNNYFIGAMFLLILVTMFISSPSLMVASSLFGVVYLGFVYLLKQSTISLNLGAISFLIMAGIIIIIKLNKKDEQ